MTKLTTDKRAVSVVNTIHIRGARTHNLKNISLDIPKHKLIVITGVSGSGKSSLAFDTLYAEGQRRYVESLSSYARQFLQLMDKPDVDMIEGLSPAIAIEQKATSHNPRSTVGTITEIHDYLRLFFARVGTPHCPTHDHPLEVQNISQMVDDTLQLEESSKIMILAPVLHQSNHVALIQKIHELEAQGYVRFRINRDIHTVTELPEFSLDNHYDCDVVIDRLKIRADAQQRLAESFETALAIGHGKAIRHNLEDNSETIYSNEYACPLCDYQISTLEPQLFSFNNPTGACPDCHGMGQTHFFDPEKVIAFPSLGLRNGAIKGWDKRNLFYQKLLESLAIFYDFDLDTAFEELPPEIQRSLLYGSGSQLIPFSYINEKGSVEVKEHAFEGILNNFERRWQETESSNVKEELGKYRSLRTCPSCHGSRLCIEARHVFIGNDSQRQSIFGLEALSLAQCLTWFEELQLQGSKQVIAERIIQEIQSRLHFLNNVGLTYLSLDRSANTISGGEAQRIRLASQIGTGLTGVMYVLDEPSIGLHQRDNDRLIHTLQQLRDMSNTVIVVEHDEDMIRAADYVIDMGPYAGEHGGQVTACGSTEELCANPQSLTGQYMTRQLSIATEHQARHIHSQSNNPDSWFHLYGCSGNNLKNIDLHLPIQRLVCITGVSGSGKSTLINDTLVPLLAHHFHRSQAEPAPYDRVENMNLFDKVISVDQAPIGRTPRSNPATYTGLFTHIREIFADLPEARARGYDLGRFSFNVKGGRCETCQGDGVIKVEMHFLPDVYVPCDVCHGSRYSRETLDIRYKGLSISDVLNLTVEQALRIFEAVPNITRKLKTLIEVGLGYVRLGQSATTLSGGEAQRVKLALELSKKETGNTLYVLDEPTTGLHFHDIAQLLSVLQRLVDQGNSVLIIEHNLDIIRHADWVVDLGPEGGSGGGTIIAQGTPVDISQHSTSHTGRYLRPYFDH